MKKIKYGNKYCKLKLVGQENQQERRITKGLENIKAQGFLFSDTYCF
jgi:hypothetical protein